MYFVVTVLVLLIGAGTLSSVLIDYQWWREMGQLDTWWSLWTYRTAPVAAAALLALITFWIAHVTAAKSSSSAPSRDAARLVTLGLVVLAGFVALAAVDSDTVVRFFGNRAAPAATVPEWVDPVFNRPLSFYFFDLPFLRLLLGYLVTVGILAAVIHWGTARFAELKKRFPRLEAGQPIDLSDLLRASGSHETHFLRGLAVVLLLTMAAYVYLGRFEMLTNTHGFLVGMDYTDEKVRLPLTWMLMGVLVLCSVAVLFGKWRTLVVIPVVWILLQIIPGAIGALYVRPNEIALERPYLQRHIAATRSAFRLEKGFTETQFAAKLDSRPISTEAGLNRNRLLLDNVRLWEWRAFHDTLTQIQALRPYYVFPDSDVDRYQINGKMQQVLLSARELDINQLPDAQTRWINPHFVYTHGYGMVMAGANQIRPDGLPLLYIQDAPPVISTPDLKLTQPEVYYGESTHEPVFVHSAQKEFSYPKGNESVNTTYSGTGGFPVASYFLRFAAAIREGDFNILLTSLVTPDTRMMIHRRVTDRVNELASFVIWDTDPYLVLTAEGKLIWTIDGYTSSDAHPYSHRLGLRRGGSNYMRNSVKATVDAYTGATNLYVFEPDDPLIRAYQGLFPKLFQPASAMPAGIREHVRYPEFIFQVQAEVYRLFHMRDPQAFYNKEDVWDIARRATGSEGNAASIEPAYVVATLPGETKAEFLLVLPFTPRAKDNMVALMVARCDGEHLGEIRVLELSKQELVFGPLQISARIEQDQNISKDLTLWNQQGSQVVRGQILVLPLENNFLYVSPIYIQSAEARMPQLKKVVLALGDALVYRDTYAEALAELAGLRSAAQLTAATPTAPEAAGVATAAPPGPAPDAERLRQIRDRLRRFKELNGQGKWSEAGKELEALESLVGR
jgi:uncharacterized protein